MCLALAHHVPSMTVRHVQRLPGRGQAALRVDLRSSSIRRAGRGGRSGSSSVQTVRMEICFARRCLICSVQHMDYAISLILRANRVVVKIVLAPPPAGAAMSTTIRAPFPGLAQPGFLAKERTIAGPGFNRWLVPPAALAIHLCIGMAYGFSVFWLPLSRAIGITEPVAVRRPEHGLLRGDFSRPYDWKISMLGWMYTLFFVFLGSSAAHLGRLAGACRSAQGGRRVGAVLVRRAGDLRDRRLSPSDLADVARLGSHRRHRPGPGLHLAGHRR